MYKFLGKTEAKVDSKGRVFVPAVYRRMLEGAGDACLYLRVDAKTQCAKLYPSTEWEKLVEQLDAKLNLWNPEDVKLKRQFTSSFEMVELDASGRILLQKKVLDKVGIEAEALFVGVGNYFEIWKNETLEDDLMTDEDFDAALQAKMGGF